MCLCICCYMFNVYLLFYLSIFIHKHFTKDYEVIKMSPEDSVMTRISPRNNNGRLEK